MPALPRPSTADSLKRQKEHLQAKLNFYKKTAEVDYDWSTVPTLQSPMPSKPPKPARAPKQHQKYPLYPPPPRRQTLPLSEGEGDQEPQSSPSKLSSRPPSSRPSRPQSRPASSAHRPGAEGAGSAEDGDGRDNGSGGAAAADGANGAPAGTSAEGPLSLLERTLASSSQQMAAPIASPTAAPTTAPTAAPIAPPDLAPRAASPVVDFAPTQALLPTPQPAASSAALNAPYSQLPSRPPSGKWATRDSASAATALLPTGATPPRAASPLYYGAPRLGSPVRGASPLGLRAPSPPSPARATSSPPRGVDPTPTPQKNRLVQISALRPESFEMDAQARKTWFMGAVDWAEARSVMRGRDGAHNTGEGLFGDPAKADLGVVTKAVSLRHSRASGGGGCGSSLGLMRSRESAWPDPRRRQLSPGRDPTMHPGPASDNRGRITDPRLAAAIREAQRAYDPASDQPTGGGPGLGMVMRARRVQLLSASRAAGRFENQVKAPPDYTAPDRKMW